MWLLSIGDVMGQGEGTNLVWVSIIGVVYAINISRAQ